MPFCHGDQTQFVNAIFALGVGTKLLRPENTQLKELGNPTSVSYVRNRVKYTHDFGNPYPKLCHCGNQLYIGHDRNRFVVNEAGIVGPKDSSISCKRLTRSTPHQKCNSFDNLVTLAV